MHDIACKCTTYEAFFAWATRLGLTTANDLLGVSEKHEAIVWVGRVESAPATFDAAGGLLSPPIYYDGEWAILRGTEQLLDDAAATTVDGVEIVAPALAPPIGWDWRNRPQTPSEAQLISRAVDTRVAEAAAACDAILAPLAARFGVYERDTWPAQLAEARALLADPALADAPDPESEDPAKRIDQIPTIRIITSVTGEDMGDFAAAVVKNNDDWLRITGYVAGQRQTFVASIKALAAQDGTRADDILSANLSIVLPQ